MRSLLSLNGKALDVLAIKESLAGCGSNRREVSSVRNLLDATRRHIQSPSNIGGGERWFYSSHLCSANIIR